MSSVSVARGGNLTLGNPDGAWLSHLSHADTPRAILQGRRSLREDLVTKLCNGRYVACTRDTRQGSIEANA